MKVFVVCEMGVNPPEFDVFSSLHTARNSLEREGYWLRVIKDEVEIYELVLDDNEMYEAWIITKEVL